MKASQNEEKRITLRPGAEDEVAREKARRQRTRKFQRGNLPLVAMGVLLLLLFFLSAGLLVKVSPEHFYLSYILELSRQKLGHLFDFIVGRGAEGGIQFVVSRYVMIVLAGAGLAACGAVYNGAFRNVLAAPSTLGVQSGGTLGNLLYVLLFVSPTTQVIRYSDSLDLAESYTLLDRNIQQIMVLVGCFLAVALVVGVATLAGRRRVNTLYLILAGTIFSSLIGSLVGLVQYYMLEMDPYDVRIEIIRNLAMGSFDRAYTPEHLAMMCALLLPCLAVLTLLSGKLDLLALGEEAAATKGLPVKRFFFLVIAVNTVMAATVIAFCGQIGFVGFIVPQAARRVVGPGFRRLLPASMLLGGILLILVYDIALLTGFTAYINLFTSGLGSAVMIAALLTGKGVRRAAA